MGLLDQDKNKLLGANGQADGGVSANQVPLASSGGGFAGQGAGSGSGPSGQVGSGGVGQGWTNIQTYLNANKGSTASSNALNKTVGGAFDTESSKLTTESDKAKTDAKAQVDQNKIGQDQASKLITEAAPGYGYGGQHSDIYKQNTGKLKGSLSAQYGGPTSFAYGMGAEAKEYGTNLGSDAGFKAVMNSLYDKSGGGAMGSGMRSLQSQLDQENPLVQQAKESLLSKYAGLQGNIENTVKDTDAAVKGYQKQFGDDQGALRDYLVGESTWRGNAMRDEVDRTNKAVQDAINRYPDRYMLDGKQIPMPDDTSPLEAGTQVWDYTPMNIGTASAENLRSLDPTRSEYNTIDDILGLGSAISRDEAGFNPGSIRKEVTVRTPDGGKVTVDTSDMDLWDVINGGGAMDPLQPGFGGGLGLQTGGPVGTPDEQPYDPYGQPIKYPFY